MNKLVCGLCRYYDPILSSGEKETKRGMCSLRSIYPSHEGPGQVFPTGVRRAKTGDLAEPFIVKKDQLIAPCEDARPSRSNPVEEKKKKQAKLFRKGRRH